jgi:hypothetical protein
MRSLITTTILGLGVLGFAGATATPAQASWLSDALHGPRETAYYPVPTPIPTPVPTPVPYPVPTYPVPTYPVAYPRPAYSYYAPVAPMYPAPAYVPQRSFYAPRFETERRDWQPERHDGRYEWRYYPR